MVLVCAWMLLQMLVLGRLSEARAQHLLYLDYRTQLATETAPTGALDFDDKPVAEGSPVALLSIPALGLDDVVVVDGTASGDLLNGPGHLRTTPLPGNVGASLVMGRSTTYGAPFGSIASLHAGDTIHVLGAQGPVTYTVTDVRRAGDPIPPPPTGAKARPADPRHGRQHRLPRPRCGRATWCTSTPTPRRPSPRGRSTRRSPTAEKAMQNDTSALPLLVLLLALVARSSSP